MFPLVQSLAGPAISGLFSMLGSQANANAQAQTNQAMLNQSERQFGIQTQEWDTANAEAMTQQNFANQMAQAQWNQGNYLNANGIQMRVDDARKAGINPLAALGAPSMSAPAVSVGGGSAPNPVHGDVASLTAPQPGTAMAGIGQDISRALQSMQSPEEKAVAVTKTAQDLERGQLENDLLKKQIYGSAIAVHSQPGSAPGVPGRPPSNDELSTANSPNDRQVSGPAKGTEGWSWMDPFAKFQYGVRNQVLPWFGYNIPKDVKRSPGWSPYKDPASGWYYQLPNASTVLGGIRSLPSIYSGFNSSQISP